MLIVDNLRKTYGTLVAVEGITLNLEPGDVFGFIGPNGAGKTTTIKMVATLLRPTSGTASVDGIDVVRYPREVRPLIGYMPDAFGVYDDVKVWEYLDFFAAAYRPPKEERPAIIERVLTLTDLQEKRDAFVQTLSRGMQQRLCLAKCLVHDPKLLLLDEPASGLDPRARIEIKKLIARLGEMGKTVIVSSHILPELADFCNKIGIMERGHLLVSGDVQDIVRQMQPTRQILIRTLPERDVLARMRATLEGFEGVEKLVLESDERTVRVAYAGELEGQVAMLKALVEADVPVCSFAETALDLEDVFLRVTTGKVH
ncbi:MAG TPA: ABC transporter ATP-binding protein [Armatimonadaceae bacterium]|nr:ABC transporter ATP-binding protein [Armatimonadaceae bacterium]